MQSVVIYGFILNDKNEFLIVRRAEQDTHPGLWEMPGGTLELNESLGEGVQRELKEETGLDVTVLQILAAKAMMSKVRKQQTVRIVYKCRMTDLNQQVILSPEHSKFAWVTQDSIGDKNLSDFLVYTLEQVA